jgi:hypothetical protein
MCGPSGERPDEKEISQLEAICGAWAFGASENFNTLTFA